MGYVSERHLTATGHNSAAILLDIKPTRVHFPEMLRTKCFCCGGFAENRGFCVHEVKLLAEIESRHEYMKPTRTVVEVGNESEEEEFSGNQDESKLRAPVYYIFWRSRRFFACASDEKSVMQVFNTTTQNKSNVQQNNDQLLVYLKHPTLFLYL